MNAMLITGLVAGFFGVQEEPRNTQDRNIQDLNTQEMGSDFAVYRARDLVGSKVENASDEKLGEIEDIVISPDGRISYAVLSFGGFLDIGDKLFALPWNCLRVDHMAQGDPGERTFVLDIPKERLKDAPGFDKDEWPRTAGAEWCGDVDAYYANDVDPQDKRAIAASASKGAYVLRCSELKGMAVENTADEKLGDIHDLVLDPSNGRVSYAVLSVGGFLGIGDKLVAVPWQALQIDRVDEETQVRLPATKELLEKAPVFLDDRLAWERMGNREWIRDDVYGYFQVDPYWDDAPEHDRTMPKESTEPRR